MILSREQRIGATILFGIALIVWFIAALWPTFTEQPEEPKKHHRTWEERKDSMKRADSLRYAQWAEEREQRYDSFRLSDSLRRIEWKRIRQQQYDSFRLADSLWRDSVGWRFVKHVKKDTILDLNHCDTTELQYIRGIGHFTAVQIIRYREQLGGYCSPEQLKDELLLTSVRHPAIPLHRGHGRCAAYSRKQLFYRPFAASSVSALQTGEGYLHPSSPAYSPPRHRRFAKSAGTDRR